MRTTSSASLPSGMTSEVPATTAGSQVKPARIVLSVLLLYVVLLGGSEAGTFTAGLRALNAVIGGGLVAWWMLLLRREADRVDALTIGALLAFLAACVLSEYPRHSFDAAVSALAWAAAFGVARRHLARYRERRLLIRLLSLCGLLLSLYFVASWGPAWVEWVRLSRTAPPFDLTLPVHIFRHQYVVAMLLATLMPASAALLRDRAWRYAGGLTLILSVLLILMSGSRGVWLAIALAAVALIWRVRPSRRLVTIGFVSMLGIVALGALLGLVGPMVSRILASSTVTFRFDIWSSTLAMWSERPWFGIGPGTFGVGITFQPLQDTYLFGARHADNALIQLAAEAGAAGVLGAVLAVVAVWTSRGISRRGWLATIAIITVAGASLTNNPFDTPNLVAIVIAWAAYLAPYPAGGGPAESVARARTPLTASTGVAAVAVAAAVVVTSVASLSHAAGVSAAQRGDLAGAISYIGRAASLDPAMGLYRRELGALLVADGRVPFGVSELERAVALNPADTAAMRALALARSAAGDDAGAVSMAERATGLRPLYPENHLVLALVGDDEVADSAIREALTLSPWLPASSAWTDPLPLGTDLDRAVHDAAQRATNEPAPRRALSIVWLRAIAGLPPPELDSVGGEVALEALGLVVGCRTEDATERLRELGAAWPGSAAGTISRILLDREREATDLADTIALASHQQRDLAAAAAHLLAPFAASADPQEDARLYRRLSMGIATPGPTIPRDADGTSGWLRGMNRAACAE